MGEALRGKGFRVWARNAGSGFWRVGSSAKIYVKEMRYQTRICRMFWKRTGFADVVFLPLPRTGKPAIIVELKYGKSAGEAVRQIKERQYFRALEGYGGEILLVGVNYDKNNSNKPHSCVIEKLTV